VPPGDSWVVLRYLRQPGAAFTVTDATGVRLDVQTPPGTTPSWPVATFPVHAASEGVTTISLRPASEVWLADIRSFSPPADYSPESAPFLAWSLHPDAQFPLTAPALLPLAACAAPPCALRLEYFAEKGRDFALTVGAGAVQRLAFADVAAPGWRTLTVPAPGAGPVVARIEPLGAAPVLVRHLGWGHLGWE
jgi:hypothetical protein